MIAGTFRPLFVSCGRMMSIETWSVTPSESWSSPATGIVTR
jgi:hypothetical protein